MYAHVIERSRQFVEDECKKSTSHYGYDAFCNHFIPMVAYAIMLASKHGADVEIVTIAAWLHDIGSIVHGRDDHNETGARIAEQKLREFEYPEDRIQRVKKCILHHRGSLGITAETLEEQIIQEADAMSAFCNLDGLFMAAIAEEKLLQEAARLSVIEKLKNKWQQLCLEGSREMVLSRYEAAMLLLQK